jgi:hypothetical protein
MIDWIPRPKQRFNAVRRTKLADFEKGTIFPERPDCANPQYCTAIHSIFLDAKDAGGYARIFYFENWRFEKVKR